MILDTLYCWELGAGCNAWERFGGDIFTILRKIWNKMYFCNFLGEHKKVTERLPSLQFSKFYRWTKIMYERKVWNQVWNCSKVIRNFSARGDEVRICLWLSGDPEFHESIRLNAYTSLKRRHLNSMRPIFTGKSSRKYCNVYLTMHDYLEVF